ncbi:MAG TPA: hypothetical protein GX744_06825 [Firmicutes bacterium]|jgi:hypothetical protein|nr:hypothetical protein [Bacillota bacterium]
MDISRTAKGRLLLNGTMTDKDLLELVAVQADGLITRMDRLEAKFNGLTEELGKVNGIVVRIENGQGQKLGVLLNGYKQNAERLERPGVNLKLRVAMEMKQGAVMDLK